MTNNIKYRPDIDGLRAIAVVSVILFHFNANWLPGGFLGVDIFFVISGFLITSIITRQMEQKRFTFRDFYARRIKRILPLFFTVLIVTIIVAALLFSTRDYDAFWRTVKYAMQFRANRAFSGQNYFDPVSEEKPLLHLWSLAIEEQFYFIWPLTLLAIFWLVKNRKNPRLWAFWISIAGIILSLIYTELRLQTQPGKAYFELATRASELLVGCALALNPFHIHERFKKALGILGILVLIVCFAFYSESIPFPGITAMLPTIAAAFFILDSNTEANYKKIFTNPVARTIGLWSFSLYLWHWPVLAFMRYIFNDTTLPTSWMLSAILIIVGLSIFTYYFVENPIRRLKWKFLPSFLFIYILPAFIVVGLHHATISQPLAKKLHLDEPRGVIDWAESNQVCMDSPITDHCYVGNLEANTKILVIGDSHAAHLANFMNIVGQKENFRAHMLASGGCGFPPSETLQKVFMARPNATCFQINDYLLKDSGNYDAVVISQYLAPKFEEPGEIDNNYREKFKSTVGKVAQKSPAVYLISDIQKLNVPSLSRFQKLKSLGLENYMKTSSLYDTEAANNYLKSIAESIPNVFFVDVNAFIPKDGLIDNIPVYFDDNHLNLYGSEKVGESFIRSESLLKNDDNQTF